MTGFQYTLILIYDMDLLISRGNMASTQVIVLKHLESLFAFVFMAKWHLKYIPMTLANSFRKEQTNTQPFAYVSLKVVPNENPTCFLARKPAVVRILSSHCTKLNTYFCNFLVARL